MQDVFEVLVEELEDEEAPVEGPGGELVFRVEGLGFRIWDLGCRACTIQR